MSTYRELFAWQEARVLYKMTYEMVSLLPKNEEYALSSQMRRAAISISSNIAEGQGRGTIRDYIHFLYNARGSSYELESQIIACSDLGFVDRKLLTDLYEQVQKVIRLLNGLIQALYKKEEKGEGKEIREDVLAYGNPVEV